MRGKQSKHTSAQKVPKVIFFELEQLKHKQVFSRDSPGHGAPGLSLSNERCVLYGGAAAAAAALSHGDGGGYKPAKSGFQVVPLCGSLSGEYFSVWCDRLPLTLGIVVCGSPWASPDSMSELLLSAPIPFCGGAVCPDFFRQNAQDIAQNARKNAPALNVNFFIAFLDVSGWLYSLKNFTFLFFEK